MNDFTIQNHGSIFLLVPETPAAETWVAEHMTDPETQTWGGGIVVQHRYIQDIVEGARADGLTVA